MNPKDLVNGKTLVAGGVLITFWNNIQNMGRSFVSLFWRSEYFSGELGVEIFESIISNSKVFKWGNKQYSNEFVWSTKRGKNIRVIAGKPDMYLCLYKNRIPLIMNYDIGYSGDYNSSILTISYSSLLFSLDDILKKCQENFFNKSLKKSRSCYFLYNSSGSGLSIEKTFNASSAEPITARKGRSPSDSNQDIEFVPLLKHHADYYGFDYTGEVLGEPILNDKKAYFKSDTYYELVSEIKFWMNNRDWYETRGIIWKRGALLTGKQGTGKSRMVREACQELNIPIAQFNIADMTSFDFESSFKTYSNLGLNGMGCIVLIEDIDVVFHGRTNILQGNLQTKLLSFDTLINTISGVKENSGVFIIVTTNHPEKLDPALVRPGRLDAHINVSSLSREGYQFIAEKTLQGYDNEIVVAVEEGATKEMTVSEFENYCIEVAIDCIERDKKLGILK